MTADRSELRVAIARACFEAHATGDRAALDEHLAEDLVFFSPADLGIDRTTYFERCRPGAARITGFASERLQAVCEHEVLATYEATKPDGGRFRNTEILTFDADGRIARVEAYLGCDLPA